MANPFSTSPHDPVKSAELFNVVQFFRGSGGHEYLARNIPAEAAVDLLFDRQNTVGARFGSWSASSSPTRSTRFVLSGVTASA
jgi:hypothetical protein